jgi:hypothetical protein
MKIQRPTLLSCTALLIGLLAPACSRPSATPGPAETALPTASAPSPTAPAPSPTAEPASPPAASPPSAPAPAAAAPRPSERLRGQLIATLGGFEHIVSKEELLRLGTPAELTPALASIYQDPSAPIHVRNQALASLRFFPGAESRTTLERAIMSAETSDTARRAAVKAYAVGFGPQAVPILARMLDHSELHTRNAAAQSLSEIGDGPAQQALRRRLPRETEPMVRKTIETALSR